MISQIESDLIRLLKACGLDRETTVSVVGLAKTDENRQKMIDMIIARYDQKGEVTEQDIQKIGLILTGERKSSAPSSTRTAADTE